MTTLKIGDLTITPLSDGNFTLPRTIFPNAGDQDAGLEMPATLNSFLITDKNRKILIDTGAGKTFADTLGCLPRALAEQNTNPFDITDIFLTHGHLDHLGGLVTQEGDIIFPHAEIYIQDHELSFWFNDDIYNSVDEGTKFYFNIARKALTPYKNTDQIKTFKANADMGGGIFAVDLPGHTAGHTGFRLTSSNDQLVIWGDIIHIPSIQMLHPEWSNNFDFDNDVANKTRQRILDEVATDHIKITGLHLPHPHFFFVKKINDGFCFSEN